MHLTCAGTHLPGTSRHRACHGPIPPSSSWASSGLPECIGGSTLCSAVLICSHLTKALGALWLREEARKAGDRNWDCGIQMSQVHSGQWGCKSLNGPRGCWPAVPGVRWAGLHCLPPLHVGIKTKFHQIRTFFFFFCLFRATLVAYGGSQAGGLIGATGTSLHHSHNNAGSELCLQTTPQLMATPDP